MAVQEKCPFSGQNGEFKMREHGPKCLKLKNWVDGTEIVDTLHHKVKDVSEIKSSWHQFLAWNIAWILARTHFWQKSFKASRRVGRRQFQINVLAPSALGWVFSLGCLSGDSAYFDTLLSRSQRRRSFWSATGLIKRIEGLWERDWWLCRQTSHPCAQKQFLFRRITMINHSRVCSPGERWLESRET